MRKYRYVPSDFLARGLLLLLLLINQPWLSHECSFLVTNMLPPEISTDHVLSYSNSIQARRGPDGTSQKRTRGHLWMHNLLHMTGNVKTLQPFTAGDVWAVYNGEIYNAENLTEDDGTSDGRAIIPSYLSKGASFAKEFDGEFAVLLVDYGKLTMILASDTFGTKPLFFHVSPGLSFAVSSYSSAIERLVQPSPLPEQIPPNTIITYSLDPDTFSPLLESKTVSTLRTFDLRQHKTSTVDFVRAFKNAIHKRSKHLKTTPFVGLSAGYDSGAIACALANQKTPMNAYTVRGQENVEVVEKRLAYVSSRTTLLGNETFEMSPTEYAAQSAELLVLCEGHMYPPNLGYANYRSGKEMDMRIDPGAVGLSRICHAARRDAALVYFSGTGADEIISDYGFNGNKLTPHSSFGGRFPENLREVYPWYNFFGGTQRAYLMKEELVAGSYGIEARYPFLDVEVVQEFLWLEADVKNSEYKRPIADLLRDLDCPFDANKKVGFSVNPTPQEDDELEERSDLVASILEDHECPHPNVDLDGILAFALTPKLKVEVLEYYTSRHPDCPRIHVLLAELYIYSSNHSNFSAEESFGKAIAAETDLDKKKAICSQAALAMFSVVRISSAIQFLITAVSMAGQTPIYIYNTIATAFIGNSPLFLDPRFALSNSEAAELEKLLSSVLENKVRVYESQNDRLRKRIWTMETYSTDGFHTLRSLLQSDAISNPNFTIYYLL